MDIFKVRKANIEDAKSLAKCMYRSYIGYTDRLTKDQIPPLNIDYAEEIKTSSTWVLICRDQIIGGLFMDFGEKAYLLNIAVDPDFKGQKLGKKLMDYAEEMARLKQYTELNLATHILLSENISLYMHLGYTEVHRTDTKIFMHKKLES